jgi:hypothetical protein
MERICTMPALYQQRVFCPEVEPMDFFEAMTGWKEDT